MAHLRGMRPARYEKVGMSGNTPYSSFCTDTMSDYAKFIPQKELVYLLNLIIHMAAIECKVAMCICRLLDFELLLELKFEQKKGTSLVKLVVTTTERLSVPDIYLDIRVGISQTSHLPSVRLTAFVLWPSYNGHFWGYIFGAYFPQKSDILPPF
jgi:hypothetical protein